MKRTDFIKLLGLTPLSMGMSGLNDLSKLADSLPAADRMPALFLGHGSPMNAIEENEFVAGFRRAAANLPSKPKAILCVSAHWFTRGTKVTAMRQPETIHDFGGFPQALFDVQYPAPGDPELAGQVAQMLQPTNVELSHDWGLDHGAWSVIKHMFPEADIPVIQLSIDYTKPAQYHYNLAKQLESLRNKGVLIIGSGNIVHNLRQVAWNKANVDNFGFDWAIEAQTEINQMVLENNVNPLINYQNRSAAWNLAIPSPDHYLPLIYTMGLKTSRDEVSLFNDKYVMGSLSMTSVLIE